MVSRITELSCFKAYDVRGELGKNFDKNICYRIARAFVQALNAKTVVLGRDIRQTSPELAQAIAEGLIDEGAIVLDIGLAGTEEMYWGTTFFDACGGIEVTASHNPINFNGLKMVKSGSRPLDPETDFIKIKKIAESDQFNEVKLKGRRVDKGSELKKAYIAKLLTFVEANVIPSMKIMVNSGNGAAGPTFDLLELALSKITNKLTFDKVHHIPDSSFPNGIPNPLLSENHLENKDLIIKAGANMGIAFDGDFDRCFFFDENGDFVPGQYIVGLLAETFLLKEPGATIIHDHRVIWNIQHVINKCGGLAKSSQTGHAFIKQSMRENVALYGGEISAHHYFRDFAYCDSGMIPWLLIVELMGRTGKPLSELVKIQKTMFPSSGEINFKLKNPKSSIQKVLNFYADQISAKDEFDGLSLIFDNWRLNLRCSNTEPLVRLNIESRGNSELIKEKIAEVKKLLYK